MNVDLCIQSDFRSSAVLLFVPHFDCGAESSEPRLGEQSFGSCVIPGPLVLVSFVAALSHPLLSFAAVFLSTVSVSVLHAGSPILCGNKVLLCKIPLETYLLMG